METVYLVQDAQDTRTTPTSYQTTTSTSLTMETAKKEENLPP